ncbi:GGDEF domain-containing phosphodiesterase [Idiomarina aminovorans]|uniref:GGDEF domain-containing phosphodiesterase n=1 Tax=Idiomarina aminovorans TaxID=2914829 RepID=UPI002005ACF8|nr:GGDEF domain-containing phosphodiesterase [Idiomarina sp. ATCH4]MCK7459537.1 EAL domain-containing protein [Idiomarina sp. ATCH4]
MKDKIDLATSKKWHIPFLHRPEVMLVLGYILATSVWGLGTYAVISYLTLEPNVKQIFVQLRLWGLVAFSIIFPFVFIRSWVLRLNRSRQLLYSYLENSPTVHYELCANESEIRIDWVSPNCERIIGYTTEEIKAPGWWQQNIHPNDLQLAKKTILRGIEEAHFFYEYRFRHKQGHYVWIRDELRRTNKRPLSFQGVWTNISADYIESSNGNTGDISEHGVLCGIALLDKHRRIISVDTSFTEISGMNESISLNSKLEELLTTTDIDDLESHFPCNQNILIVGRNADNRRYSANLTIKEAIQGFSERAVYIATLSDVTRMKQQQRQLQRLAFFDDLTRLPNGNSLTLDLSKLLDELPSDRLAAVLVMNINRFHQVNDKYGHHIGDKILQRLTQRLKEVTPFGTKLYNLGGDEFAIVLNHVVEYIDIQNIILQIQKAYERPFVLASNDQQIELTASIGASVYPLDGYDAGKLLAEANLAMNSAKDQNNENQTYFKQELERRSYHEIQLEEDVHSVLQNHQMQLVYQPVLNMDKQVVGVEALLRWEHPELGTLYPEQFLSQFDANGMLDTLGIWVIENVVAQIGSWQQQGITPGRVAVNLATEQISKRLYQAMSRLNIENPQLLANIEFDLSESSLSEPLPDTLDIIEQLQQLGITLVIDRFGKGIGSMLHLKTMAVSKIKIEREFIRDLDTNERSRNLVKAISRMTSELDLEVQAVGVENQAQFDKLKEFGCHYWQGQLYKLPQAADEVFIND